MYHAFPGDQLRLPASDAETPPLDAPPPRRAARRAGLIGLVALLVLGFGLYRLLGAGEAQADAPPPPTVTVAQPLQRDVVEYEDFTGRFEASQSVEIRPRVSGQLVGIHFRDGELVRRGQLLFTIDERPFRAALAEAQARLAAAQSALALANSEHARAARLVDDEAVSREEVESLRAAVRSGAAQVAAAEAVVRQRALDLEFTRVRAPIAGRVSDRRIDVGNLVAANESMLTTLLALDPIHFAFDGSEALHLKAMRARQAGGDAASEVQIRLQDESGYGWRGRVDFSDNAIDNGSGTLRGRAVVANPDHFLTPGMFGEMRLAAGAARPALLVPDAAVQADQARKIVLVVQPDGTTAVRPVETGARIGTLRIIRAGLRPTDRVVVEGIQLARPGSRVNARVTRIAPPADAAGATARTPQSAPPASQATLAG
jgi:membrane fusion protein, multidrug efflux system